MPEASGGRSRGSIKASDDLEDIGRSQEDLLAEIIEELRTLTFLLKNAFECDIEDYNNGTE
jgi:hypothetical protein